MPTGAGLSASAVLCVHLCKEKANCVERRDVEVGSKLCAHSKQSRGGVENKQKKSQLFEPNSAKDLNEEKDKCLGNTDTLLLNFH